MTEQDRPTKISFIYSNPTDPDAFESAYPGQLALARNLPGLTRLQASRVWPKEDGSPTPAYRLLDLYFAGYAAASAAAAEAGERLGTLGRRPVGDTGEAVGGRTDIVQRDHEVGAKGTLFPRWRPTNP